jgi:hypothetical protein
LITMKAWVEANLADEFHQYSSWSMAAPTICGQTGMVASSCV